MNLTKSALKRIRKSPEAIGAIILATKKSYPTVMRWLDNNHENLTTASSLRAICRVLETTQDEILEQAKA